MFRHASSGVQVASSSLSKISPASALCSFPLYSAATRWCHGASWRSPASLRAQTRIAALVLEKFKRNFATIGNYLMVYLCFISSLACDTRIPCLLCCFILHFGDTVVHFNVAKVFSVFIFFRNQKLEANSCDDVLNMIIFVSISNLKVM